MARLPLWIKPFNKRRANSGSYLAACHGTGCFPPKRGTGLCARAMVDKGRPPLESLQQSTVSTMYALENGEDGVGGGGLAQHSESAAHVPYYSHRGHEVHHAYTYTAVLESLGLLGFSRRAVALDPGMYQSQISSVVAGI